MAGVLSLCSANTSHKHVLLANARHDRCLDKLLELFFRTQIQNDGKETAWARRSSWKERTKGADELYGTDELT